MCGILKFGLVSIGKTSSFIKPSPACSPNSKLRDNNNCMPKHISPIGFLFCEKSTMALSILASFSLFFALLNAPTLGKIKRSYDWSF